MRLISENMGGNWHDVARVVNEVGWADYLFAVDSMSGYYTVVMFRVPDDFPYFNLRHARAELLNDRADDVEI